MHRHRRRAFLVVLMFTAFAALAPGRGAQAQSSGPLRLFLPLVSKNALADLVLVASADTFIHAGSPTANYGSSPVLKVGNDQLDPPQPGQGVLRALVRFTLPAQGAQPITRATLRIYYLGSSVVGGSPPTSVTIHAGTKAWDESKATWEDNQSGYSNDEYGQTVINSYDTAGYRDVDITALVQQWYDGSLANNGLYLIGPEDPGSNSAFHVFLSRESASTDKPYPPMLILEF